MGAVNTEIQYIWIFRSIIEYIRAKNGEFEGFEVGEFLGL